VHRLSGCVAAVGIALAVGVPAAEAAPLAVSQVSISPSRAPSAQGKAVFQLSTLLTNTGATAAKNVSISESIYGRQITKVSHTSTIATGCRVVSPATGYTLGRRCAISRLGAGKSWRLTFSVTAAAGTQLSGYALARATVAGAVVTAATPGLAAATTAPNPGTNGYWSGYWTWNSANQLWFWTWAWYSNQTGWTTVS
jgi:hypothetical protein